MGVSSRDGMHIFKILKSKEAPNHEGANNLCTHIV